MFGLNFSRTTFSPSGRRRCKSSSDAADVTSSAAPSEKEMLSVWLGRMEVRVRHQACSRSSWVLIPNASPVYARMHA